MPATPPFRAFGYTHVLYEEGDILGFWFALFSLTPVFVMVAYATLIASRRDFATCTLALGQLLNEVVNYVLKRVIREPRPATPHLDFGSQPKWGMPSDHSQFVGFAVGYLTLWVVFKWGVRSPHKAVTLLVVYGLAAAVAYSRNYLGYHTVPQVAVGVALGLFNGIVWFSVTETFLRPLFPRLAALWVSRALLLRDCSAVPNVMRQEYDATVAAAGGGGSGSGGTSHKYSSGAAARRGGRRNDVDDHER